MMKTNVFFLATLFVALGLAKATEVVNFGVVLPTNGQDSKPREARIALEYMELVASFVGIADPEDKFDKMKEAKQNVDKAIKDCDDKTNNGNGNAWGNEKREVGNGAEMVCPDERRNLFEQGERALQCGGHCNYCCAGGWNQAYCDSIGCPCWGGQGQCRRRQLRLKEGRKLVTKEEAQDYLRRICNSDDVPAVICEEAVVDLEYAP